MRFSTSLLMAAALSLCVIQGARAQTTDDLCVSEGDDDYVVGESSMLACQTFCQSQALAPVDNYDTMLNGLCVLGTCYCTEVGIGTCQDSNQEGCDAVCYGLNEDWVGVCSNNHCQCLN
ncbi:hypothetical protein BC940DRAFT_337817 [Gongronella butleri]|nr:hypothetical protein BC940DRAFT_337817 [Gongronella butleri]